MAVQIAWIGIGNMGRGMCKNLVEKGNLSSPLIIFNRTEKRATDLRDSFPAGKILVLETIDAVISASDIIFTCVSNDAAIEGIISSALQTGHSLKHKLFVDCSTVHPKTTRALANMIKEVDAEFVASPLLGVPAMAHAGQLVCILAGASSSLERVKPYTKGVMSRMDIVFSGVDPAMATLLKIVANTLVLSMVEALAEGHTLAEKSGLGTGNLEKAIEVVFPGLYMAYSKLLSSGDYYKKDEPIVTIELARKDTGHALSLAKEYGVEMKGVDIANKHLETAQNHVGLQGDAAGIYGAVRQESGLQYEN